jgi:GDPmannose 4,6-dehydratase
VSSAILFNHESERRPSRFVTRKITLAAARIAAGVQQSVTLGNVDSRRDWGYAGDYMNALVRMATLESTQDFVIGTGVAHSVRDLAALAFSEVGLNYLDHVETDEALTRPIDAPLRLADASAARRVLSWAPSLTFEGLIRRMVAADVARVRAGEDEGDAP